MEPPSSRPIGPSCGTVNCVSSSKCAIQVIYYLIMKLQWLMSMLGTEPVEVPRETRPNCIDAKTFCRR